MNEMLWFSVFVNGPGQVMFVFDMNEMLCRVNIYHEKVIA